MKVAAVENDQALERLKQENANFSEEAKLVKKNLAEVTTNLNNERLKVVTLEELVDKQKSSEPDLPSLEKVLKKIDDEKKQTEIEIKKVTHKLESQRVEISTQMRRTKE